MFYFCFSVPPPSLHAALTAGDLPALNTFAKRFNLDFEMIVEVLQILTDNTREGSTISPVQASVIQGNYQLCRRLIQEGGSLYSSAFNIPPPLILALQADKYQIARLLVQSGANVTIAYKSNTPMFYALKRNTPEFIVAEILKAGFPVDGKIEETHGMTTLHRAVACENTQVVNLLIEKGANVNATDGLNLYRPLHVAVNQGFFHMVNLLMEKGASLEEECKEGYTPLFHAILGNNVKLVKRLYVLGANVLHLSSVKMIYPLNFAVSLGRREISQYLIHKGAGVLVECPVSGNLPIHDVASTEVGKKLESVRLDLAKITAMLIANGSDVEPLNKQGLTPLKLAIKEQNFSVVEVLVKEGANVNKELDMATYFHFISKFAQGEVIETMLEWGADWSGKDKNGLTAYHWAKLNPHGNVLQKFIKYGCPVDLPVSDTTLNKYNYSKNVISVLSNQNLFLFGVRKGEVGPMKAALSNGAEPGGTSCDMRSPLHFAVENGYSAVVLFMLEKGARPNCFDEAGDTPLHAAVRKGNFLICIYLLSYGACFTVPGKKSGKTPLDVAMENAKFNIVFLLKEIQAAFDCREDRHLKTLDEKLKCWQADPRLLLAFLNSVNSRGETLMNVALKKKLYKLVHSIVDFRLQPESYEEIARLQEEPKVEPKPRRWRKGKKFHRNPNHRPIQPNPM